MYKIINFKSFLKIISLALSLTLLTTSTFVEAAPISPKECNQLLTEVGFKEKALGVLSNIVERYGRKAREVGRAAKAVVPDKILLMSIGKKSKESDEEWAQRLNQSLSQVQTDKFIALAQSHSRTIESSEQLHPISVAVRSLNPIRWLRFGLSQFAQRTQQFMQRGRSYPSALMEKFEINSIHQALKVTTITAAIETLNLAKNKLIEATESDSYSADALSNLEQNVSDAQENVDKILGPIEQFSELMEETIDRMGERQMKIWESLLQTEVVELKIAVLKSAITKDKNFVENVISYPEYKSDENGENGQLVIEHTNFADKEDLLAYIEKTKKELYDLKGGVLSRRHGKINTELRELALSWRVLELTKNHLLAFQKNLARENKELEPQVLEILSRLTWALDTNREDEKIKYWDSALGRAKLVFSNFATTSLSLRRLYWTMLIQEYFFYFGAASETFAGKVIKMLKKAYDKETHTAQKAKVETFLKSIDDNKESPNFNIRGAIWAISLLSTLGVSGPTALNGTADLSYWTLEAVSANSFSRSEVVGSGDNISLENKLCLVGTSCDNESDFNARLKEHIDNDLTAHPFEIAYRVAAFVDQNYLGLGGAWPTHGPYVRYAVDWAQTNWQKEVSLRNTMRVDTVTNQNETSQLIHDLQTERLSELRASIQNYAFASYARNVELTISMVSQNQGLSDFLTNTINDSMISRNQGQLPEQQRSRLAQFADAVVKMNGNIDEVTDDQLRETYDFSGLPVEYVYLALDMAHIYKFVQAQTIELNASAISGSQMSATSGKLWEKVDAYIKGRLKVNLATADLAAGTSPFNDK